MLQYFNSSEMKRKFFPLYKSPSKFVFMHISPIFLNFYCQETERMANSRLRRTTPQNEKQKHRRELKNP